MKINEAITHEKRMSKDSEVYNSENNVNYHKQIAEWLEELSRRRAEELFRKTDEKAIRDKAIDDFVKLAKEHEFKYRKYDITNCVIDFIQFFAEELKEG